MKPIAFILLGLAALTASGQITPVLPAAPPSIQAYTAVLWTTNTRHSSPGKSSIWTQRTVLSRDSAGNVRRQIYKPTTGLQHDTSAPLDRVITTYKPAGQLVSSLTQPLLPTFGATRETLQTVDLGTRQISGLLTNGRRVTYTDSSGQVTHTLETWYSPVLGTIIHLENSRTNGDDTLTDLSELNLAAPAQPILTTPSTMAPANSLAPANVPAVTTTSPAATCQVPLLILYRGLFAHIAHMERDRQSNDPSLHVNMDEIEDHLRKKLELSPGAWKVLVDKSVSIEAYSREKSKEARAFANRDREARRANPLAQANIRAAGHDTLRNMQQNLNTHIQAEIDQLQSNLGATATQHLQAYLQGPMASSMSITSIKLARSEMQRRKVDAQ